MSVIETAYWSPDLPKRLAIRASFLEKLLRSVGRLSLRTAIRMHERRVAAAERGLYQPTTDIPAYLRRDLGLPPFEQIVDVSQYR
jgi:hypothetical protein